MIMAMSNMTGMDLWDDYLRCGSLDFMRDIIPLGRMQIEQC